MEEAEEIEFEIVAVVNAKGGAGKTTFTMLLGSAALASNREVVFIDTDPQGSLKEWWELSKKAGNLPPQCLGLAARTTQEVMNCLKKLAADKFDGLVLIDTAGVGDKSTLDLVNISDVVAVPCMISERALRTTLEVLKFLRKHISGLNTEPKPALKLVRNAVPKARDLTKRHTALFDELGREPECIQQVVQRHNLLEVWSDEGPLYTRFAKQKESGTLEVGQARNTLAVLEEGVAVINGLFEDEGG